MAPLGKLLLRPRSACSHLPPAHLPSPRTLGPATLTLHRSPTPCRLVPVSQAGDAANVDFPRSALRTHPFPSSQLSYVTSGTQLPASELDCPAGLSRVRGGEPWSPTAAPRSPACSQRPLLPAGSGAAVRLRRVCWPATPPHPLQPVLFSFTFSQRWDLGQAGE